MQAWLCAARQGVKLTALDGKSTTASGASGQPPVLIPPRTEARWIADQIHGNTFVPAHIEYSIVESAKWATPR